MIHRFVARDKQKIIGAKYMFSILQSMKFTEKTHALSEMKKYVFLVKKEANKIEIKQAVENTFNVSVKSVNTMNYKECNMRFRGIRGKSKAYKKAVVTLLSGIIELGDIKELKDDNKK